MDGKFAKISPFQVDPDKIPQNFDLNEEDFLPAEEAEKASMVDAVHGVTRVEHDKPPPVWALPVGGQHPISPAPGLGMLPPTPL